MIEISFDNDYISDLMVTHDHVEYDGVERISNRYMDFCGKDMLAVMWRSEGNEIKLVGYGAKMRE